MDQTHLDEETMSAYLDGELGEQKQAAAEQHLRFCESCPGRIDRLRAAAAALASMPAVSLGADEHRALRLAILQSHPANRRAARWRPWLLAGGLGTAAIVAFAVLFGGGSQPDPVQDADVPAFESDRQVKQALQADPAVAAALNRPLPGREQAESGTEAGPAGQAASAPPEDEAADSPQMRQTRPESGDLGGSGQGCLEKVADAQRRPTVPISSRRVVYKSRPALMLVYASASSPAGAPDQVEAWIIPEEACRQLSGDRLLARSLHYSLLRPS